MPLSETTIPVIAIVGGVLTRDANAGEAVGVGAIFGAPFMLASFASTPSPLGATSPSSTG